MAFGGVRLHDDHEWCFEEVLWVVFIFDRHEQTIRDDNKPFASTGFRFGSRMTGSTITQHGGTQHGG